MLAKTARACSIGEPEALIGALRLKINVVFWLVLVTFPEPALLIPGRFSLLMFCADLSNAGKMSWYSHVRTTAACSLEASISSRWHRDRLRILAIAER